MAVVFNKDSYVWVPDDDDMFLPAQVVSSFEQGKPGSVKMVSTGPGGKKGKSGNARKVSAQDSKKVLRMDEQSLKPIDDMVTLKNLDEASILHNLRLRYDQDAIYTNVGRILVSLNPFKMLPIYSPQVMDDYLDNGARDMDPHVYGVADDAFRALLSSGVDQSCIVSGESGAGKTEATKLFLQYVAEKSKRESSVASKGKSNDSGGIQHKVLEANPLMEAFGNAKTVRNDNSSRFGKFIKIQLTSQGEIVGGSIINYLLEKSRLVNQGEGERNYHIFYQLCAAANMDPNLKEKYNLSDATQYYYLNQSKKASTEIKNVDDADEWKSTQMALEVVKIDEANVDKMLMALAGILHLGNIRFDKGKGDDTSKVANADMLNLAAEQLGAKPDALAKALTQRMLKAGKDVTWGNNSPSAAADARDALAKGLYGLMFDWLIQQINVSLGQRKNVERHIGVLDIFGFETFEINSFEQLCINYCNEKLQGHFNNHVFKLEQAEYKKEGVDIEKIKFEDNEDVIALIEAPRGAGILAKIDEQIKTGNRASDAKLLKEVLSVAPKSNGVIQAPNMKLQKKKPHLVNCFVFKHFAGPVEYNTVGFVEKCRDTLQDALLDIGSKSSNGLIKKLFAASAKAGDKKKTLGAQFREQLVDLMKTLNSTQPHFVRCVKPNAEKVGNSFTAEMVLSQLRYAGVLEVCRIRKMGYPIRKDFKEFIRTYQPLAGSGFKDAKKLAKRLEDMDILIANEYQLGKAKIFMRDEQFDKLEVELEKVLAKHLELLQKVVRGFIVRIRGKKWKKVRKDVESAMKKRKLEPLEAALLNVGVLPYGGRHLAWVADARSLFDTLNEQKRIMDLLDTALESKDLAEIKRALKTAQEHDLGKSAGAKAAEAMIKSIEAEKKVREMLRAAIDKGDDIKTLDAAIKAADKAKLTNCVEARDAIALVERLKEQNSVINSLDKAIQAKKVSDIKKYMNRLAELGQAQHPLVLQGQKVAQEQAKASKAREDQQTRLLNELGEAVDMRNLTRLNELEVEVLQIGLEEHELVKEAMALRKELEISNDVLSAVASEMRAAIHKAEGSNGVTGAEIDGLAAALSAAKAKGVPAKDPKIVEANELIVRLEKQIEVQKDLEALAKKAESAKGKERKKMMATLVTAVESAQSLAIDTPAARKIKDWVTTIEQEDAEVNQKQLAKKRQANLERLKEASKDDLEQLAMERLTKISSEKHKKLIEQSKDDAVYELKKFYKIRTNEDYTGPLPEDERTVAAKLKLWSRQKPIPKSLLKLGEEQNRTAMRINRALLQYCGDMSTSFPATLAQYILVKGLEDPMICDEIFMQLCKHVYVNPKPESADRAWLLMCMATKTFPPSEAFAPYLINFLLKHQTLPGLPGNYARLCVVQLDATFELGPSSYKPNLEEIQQYRKRPPILAPINMVSGEVVQYPITPDLRVAQVVEMIRRQEDITDNFENPTWGIFVKDGKETGKLDPKVRLENFYRKYNKDKLRHVALFLEHWKGKEEELFSKLVEKYGPEPEEIVASKKKTMLAVPVTGAMNAVKMLGFTSSRKAPPAPQTGWPLPWWAHLGDVYLRMTTQNKEPVFEFKRRMIKPELSIDKRLYLQLLHDIQSGDLAFSDPADAAEAALLAVALNQKGFKLPKPEKLVDAGLLNYMSAAWRRQKSPVDWSMVAKNSLTDKLPRTEQKLMEMFHKVCKKSEVYGMTFFYARRSDNNSDYLVGVNHAGIHFIEKSETKMKIASSILYTKIIKYGATVEYFWLSVDDKSASMKKSILGGQGVNILLYTLQSWELYETVFDWTHLDVDEE
mmetsp:Transcript_13168/g.23373  ORF Transcript_13168/g.23373 Transcript_13168/m.23373 type:complete len:1804 (+) Transcript_13168:226-5637(+)